MGCAQSGGAEQSRFVRIFLGRFDAIQSPKSAGRFEREPEDCLQSAERVAGDFADDRLLHAGAAAVGGAEPVLSAVVHSDGFFAIHGDDQFAAVHGAVADQDAAAVDGEYEVFYFDAGVLVEFVSE